MLALGLPMILMGDEVRRTQQGNNNAYCQDNEISWFDWALVAKHADLRRYLRFLCAHRLTRGLDPDFGTSTLNELLRNVNGTWHGVKLEQPNWRSDSHSVAYSTVRRDGSVLFYAIFNAYWDALEFELPPATLQSPLRRLIDTSLDSPQDIVEWKDASLVTTRTYQAASRSIVVLCTEA
jgi:isoamylase